MGTEPERTGEEAYDVSAELGIRWLQNEYIVPTWQKAQAAVSGRERKIVHMTVGGRLALQTLNQSVGGLDHRRMTLCLIEISESLRGQQLFGSHLASDGDASNEDRFSGLKLLPKRRRTILHAAGTRLREGQQQSQHCREADSGTAARQGQRRCGPHSGLDAFD